MSDIVHLHSLQPLTFEHQALYDDQVSTTQLKLLKNLPKIVSRMKITLLHNALNVPPLSESCALLIEGAWGQISVVRVDFISWIKMKVHYPSIINDRVGLRMYFVVFFPFRDRPFNRSEHFGN